MRRLIPILALFALLFTTASQAAYHTRRAPEYVNDFESLTAPPAAPEVILVVIVVQADVPAAEVDIPGTSMIVVLLDQHGSCLIAHTAGGNYDLRVGNYLPEWGTFTGPDMRIDVMEANGACNYLFASNNPLVYMDPTGLYLTIGDGHDVSRESRGYFTAAGKSEFDRQVLTTSLKVFGISRWILLSERSEWQLGRGINRPLRGAIYSILPVKDV
jgi:hypothetical protein